MSRFTEAKSAGFALAALLADDRELTRVRDFLGPDDEAHIRAQSALSNEPDRAHAVARLLASVRPALRTLPPSLPARMAGLLAQRLPLAVAREVLAVAPRTRAGFELAPELAARLLRIARAGLERTRVEEQR